MAKVYGDNYVDMKVLDGHKIVARYYGGSHQ